MCHAMPFSARALKKKSIFFDVDIVVKNKSKCGFSWYVLLSITSTRHYSFPKHFFELFLHIKRVCKSFSKSLTRTSSHLHNVARAFSKTKTPFLWYCGKKQIECGLAWYIVLSITIRVITVVKICCGLTWLRLVSPHHFDHCDDAYRCR